MSKSERLDSLISIHEKMVNCIIDHENVNDFRELQAINDACFIRALNIIDKKRIISDIFFQ